MKQLEPILFIVAILVVFYLLLIRPQQNRRKQQQHLQQSIRPGSEIVTTAGMYAKVVATEGDDGLLLEVAPGVTCKYMRQSVMRVVTQEESAQAASEPHAVEEADETPEGASGSSDGTGSAADTAEQSDAEGDQRNSP